MEFHQSNSCVMTLQLKQYSYMKSNIKDSTKAKNGLRMRQHGFALLKMQEPRT